MTMYPDAAATPEEELARLRAETALLRAQLDQQERRRSRVVTLRRILAALLVVVAALGAGLSVVGVWAGRTALDTDRWVSAVGPLPEQPEVRAAVAEQLSSQLFEVLDVETKVREALPPEAAFLSAPLTTQSRELIRSSVEDVMATPEFSRLWLEANRIAHERLVAIIEGRSEVVTMADGTVTLNLLPVVNNVIVALETRLPSLVGRDIDLPEVQSGQVPEDLRTRIEQALDVTLPADFARITIYQADELAALQDGVELAKRGLAALVLLTLALAAAAIWISPDRRRTALQLGLWLVITILVLRALIRAVVAQLLEGIPAGTERAGVETALQVVFSQLRQNGYIVIGFGVVLFLVTYLAGPGRVARAIRRALGSVRSGLAPLAQRLRESGPGFARDHLDALRIAGVVVAVVLALAIPSWAALLVILVALGAYEFLVSLVAAGGQTTPGPPVADAAAESGG